MKGSSGETFSDILARPGDDSLSLEFIFEESF